MKTPVDITVRQQYGTYQTSTVSKMRASCTTGAQQAAHNLGVKLYGESLQRVESLGDGAAIGSTRWRLHAQPWLAACVAWVMGDDATATLGPKCCNKTVAVRCNGCPHAAPVASQPTPRTADCLLCGHCAANREGVLFGRGL